MTDDRSTPTPTSLHWTIQRDPTAASTWTGFDDSGLTGYEFLETLTPLGWTPLGVWGAHGWDLGDWPLHICAVWASTAGPCAFLTRIEGDLTITRFASLPAMWVHIDTYAESWWRSRPGVPDLSQWAPGELPDHYRGPYTGDHMPTDQ